MAELTETLPAGPASFTFEEFTETMFATGKATEIGYEFDGAAAARMLGLEQVSELEQALARFNKWLLGRDD